MNRKELFEALLAIPSVLGACWVWMADNSPKLAAVLTVLYTAGLLVRFWWRHALRPVAERMGWMEPKIRNLPILVSPSEWDLLQQEKDK